MTYRVLKEQIIRNLGGRTDEDSLNSVKACFNFVQKLIARDGEWEELEATKSITFTSGQADYDYVADWGITDLMKIYTIKIWDGSRFRPPLSYILPSKWDDEIATIPQTSNYPTCYTKWGAVLSFYPKPASSYTGSVLRYYKYPTPVEDDDSIITFPDLDHILVAATTGYFWAGLEETEISAYWFRLANAYYKTWTKSNRYLFGFEAYSKIKERSASRGEYWADPFQKEGG